MRARVASLKRDESKREEDEEEEEEKEEKEEGREELEVSLRN